VDEDQPPALTLSAAGTNLRREPPDSCLSPLLTPEDGGSETRFPFMGNGREHGVISLPMPLNPKGFGSLPESGSGQALFKDAQVGISTVQHSGSAHVGHRDDLTVTRLATEPSSSDPIVGGDTEGCFQSSVDVTSTLRQCECNPYFCIKKRIDSGICVHSTKGYCSIKWAWQ